MSETHKKELLDKLRANTSITFDKPDTSAIKGLEYPDVKEQFINMSRTVGSKVVEMAEGEDINNLIKSAYPDAKTFASNLPEVTIAQKDPDTVTEAADLNGTDVGIVRGMVGVAENGCVWVPQTMKERAVCFISEQLVIVLDKDSLVSNMHQAYRRINMTDYGYGCFISGPSKTADIEQALVMGAQAARGVTIILV